MDQTKPNSFALMKRLWQDSIRHYRGRLGFAILMMLISAAATAAMAKLMEPILDQIFVNKNPGELYQIAGAILFVFLAKAFANYGQESSLTYVGQKIVADLQQGMFAHLIKADLAYFHNTPTGHLLARFTHDVNLLRYAVSSGITGMGRDLLTVCFLIGIMFYQDWTLALIALFAFPLGVVPIVALGRNIRKTASRMQDQTAFYTSFLEQIFQGIRHVKAYHQENAEITRSENATDKLFKLFYRAGRIRAVASPIMEVLGGLSIIVVILYGGHQVIEGTRSTGTFFSFITALLLAYEPMKKLARLNTNLQEGLSAASRVYTVLDLSPKIIDAPNAQNLSVPEGQIEFQNVHFAYSQDHEILHDLSFTIPAKKTVALVGPSGGGKSTILNLIPRFYDVERGHILIDGQNLRDVTMQSLRQHIALVSQEISLFDASIHYNIAYSRPEASMEEIQKAAEMAAAHDFIKALPQGYDTMVGENGVKLSGGQRQRLAIARAMLKNAPILLLDEATSALDTESERQIQAALKTLAAGRTTLVIAHRLATIMDADLILVIDGGRIVEQGTHQDLIQQKGLYAHLAATQFDQNNAADYSMVS